MLARRIGVEHVEDIEDAVQSAIMSALEHWVVTDIPDNPSAWLYRVARNKLMSELRQETRRTRILREKVPLDLSIEDADLIIFTREVQDDLLRMLFVCCDEAIPLESQLVLALKTLCGFDAREIAIRLFTSEANVYKRLDRARRRLKELRPSLDELTTAQLSCRLPAVHKVLYLLFTEGYLSSNTEVALRSELCDEAIRLTLLTAEHPAGSRPETHALLALMHLHTARMPARHDGNGRLLLLEEQDRSLWNRDVIREGMRWLGKSARGDTFSQYHAEAGIAAEHCLAPSFAETRWDKIAECYQLLEQSMVSPLHRLNRAVAVAEWKGPSEGLAMLADFHPPPWLAKSYLWSAVQADLHRRCGNHSVAEHYREVAVSEAPTPLVKETLQRRLSGNSA
jgi:RNA polymerase sigma-70 factor (ECF subfamily)